MAEHRRVEPRGIVGTGMSTDPEKIQELEEEAARHKRAWHKAPEKGFGDVLKDAPARAVLADEDEAPARPGKRPTGAPDAAAMATGAMEAPDAAAPAAEAPGKAVPRVPPDPREALLRKKLARAPTAPKPVFATDTPPTGSTRKPR